MWQGWLGAEQRCGAIVLVFFVWVGLVFGNIRNFELVDVGEEHRRLGDGIDILYQDIIHRFQFADVPCKVWYDGQDRGQVSG